jgi:hypothetical protein
MHYSIICCFSVFLLLLWYDKVCVEVIIIIIFNFRTAAFMAYCAIWVTHFNFRHQASPRESTQRQKVDLWARNVQEFNLNAELHVTFRDLLHAVKLWHETDGFTSPLKEGVLRIFFALKIWRFRQGVNLRTWVPKASTLSLDHQSRMCWSYTRLQKLPSDKQQLSYKISTLYFY